MTLAGNLESSVNLCRVSTRRLQQATLIGGVVGSAVQYLAGNLGFLVLRDSNMAGSSESVGSSAAVPSHEDFFTPAYLDERRRALAKLPGPVGMDELVSPGPAGHAYAVRTSTRVTSDFRRQHRKGAMDITPQDVIDALNAGGVKDWVLMGLHGYVGYMPNPRATQDVDVMVPYGSRARAKKAIITRWPELVVRELSQVTRFADPADVDAQGRPKQVIDLMHPWSPFQELILKEYVIVDPTTQHRLPTLEAALVSKYAAIISPFRAHDDKEQDAVDFRRLVKANHDRIREDDLRRLAGLVWENGADEIVRFIQLALADQPFPS
jgi:hypothetical protein